MGHAPWGTAAHGNRRGFHGPQTPELFCPGTGLDSCLLGRGYEAVHEGQALLAGSTNSLYPLLVLARVFQSQHRWQEAARLQEEALRLAKIQIREATVRHQIGTRLFEERKYRDAAALWKTPVDARPRDYSDKFQRLQESKQR